MQTFEIPYTKTAEKVLREAGFIALESGLGAIGTEHLLLAFFKIPCLPREVLLSNDLTYEKAVNAFLQLMGETKPSVPAADTDAEKAPAEPAEMPETPIAAKRPRGRVQLPAPTPLLNLILQDARDIALDVGAEAIGTEHIFIALVQDMDGIAAKALFIMGTEPLALTESVLDSMGEEKTALEELLTTPVPPVETVTRYTRDLTALAAAGKLEPVFGREAELSRMLRILCRRTKNNPCLIGEPGVGKTAIVELLAQRIAAGQVPDFMKGKRLLSLDLASIVAGTKFRGEFEERMKAILDEIFAHPEILLFIDEFHTLIGAGSAEGTLDAANILKPALSRGEVQIIGATTLSEYRKHIEKDTALKRRFQSVLVEEPDDAATLAVLKGRKPIYEKHHKVTISDEALTACLNLSRRYITDRLWPDKALDLLDEACSGARLKAGEKPAVITAEDMAGTVALWTGIPLDQLTKQEEERLLALEDELHRRVIGQQEAISALSRAIRRSRVGLKDPNRPVGSFLFLGPTGVGKTELTKALTVSLFGDEKSLIRVDMSEYMEKHSVSKIIGSPPGYVGFDEGGQLSEKVRRHPYSVILFDEIEKAHPDVFHILLQILDEGRLTDSQGTTVDFRNTIIVMTSNAGAERIVEPKNLGFTAEQSEKADHERMKNAVMEEVKRSFRPEFINRIDEIIVFHMLNKDNIQSIFRLQLSELEKRLKDSHPLSLHLSATAMEWFVKKGYQPKFGARPLKRLIQTEIEDKLAEQLLSGRIHDGDTVEIDIEGDSPVFHSI